MPVKDEKELIERCKAGEQEAWRELVETYRDMVFAVARRVAVQSAEDAAQETFFRVFRSLGNFRGESKFSTWIYRVAYNTSLDIVSKRGIVTENPDGFEQPYGGPGPDDLTISAEYSEAVKTALKGIRPEYRTVLELYYLLGKSYKETAEITDLPIGTVKTYLHRAKKDMLKALRRKNLAGLLNGRVE